jgi:autotransporter-associated beta strand protein
MGLSAWLRNGTPNRATRFRPQLESLEDRLAPATHVWSGAVSELWSDYHNWSSGGSPVGDLAPILVFPAGSEVARFTSKNDTSDLSMDINQIEFDGEGYDLTGNSFKLDAPGVQAKNTSGTNKIEVASIQLSASFDFPVSINVASGSTLNVTSSLTDSPLRNDGDGTLMLSGANQMVSSSGVSMILNAGTLIVGNDLALSFGGNLQLNGGRIQSGAASGDTITLGNNFTVAGPVTVSGSQSLVFTGTGHLLTGQTLTVANTWDQVTLGDGFVGFRGILFGPGSLTKKGNGDLFLHGTNNYGGETQLQDGTLFVDNDSALGTGMLNLRGGTLENAFTSRTLTNPFQVSQ